MKTIKDNINHEIIINKSRFIAFLSRCFSEEEALLYLAKIKREYKDATHYCYAYIIDNIKRFNDDKEPTGTAGLPIMNILDKNNLNYIICVVVRYFGGIKLGTGGLTRAYSKSVKDSLIEDNIINLIKGIKVQIVFNYDDTKEIDYILNDSNIIEKNYDNKITYTVIIKEDNYNNILDHLNSINNIEVKKLDETFII